MGKSIVIASGKGGTGKTMVSANLGATLSRLGHQVIVIDMDTGLRNLDLYLGLENNVVYDVNDVMNGVCRIKQAILRDKSFPGLSFMAASPRRSDTEITPLHMKVLCDKLKDLYDFVIVDAPAGMDENLLIAIGGADHIVLVINPEIASMRDGEMMTAFLNETGGNFQIHYLINKLNLKLVRAGLAPSVEEVTRGMRGQVVGLIPYDENIHISTNLGVPIAFMPESPIAQNFTRIAERVRSF